jgi:hypothetical protein
MDEPKWWSMVVRPIAQLSEAARLWFGWASGDAGPPIAAIVTISTIGVRSCRRLFDDHAPWERSERPGSQEPITA